MSSDVDNSSNRWGRDLIFDILGELGIHHIFGVPGTNEIPVIDGTTLPANQVTYIECLHENIAMGAAMGAARLTGKPGVALLHVTPGIAHAIGNLFNASRSRLPLVVLCSQQQNELVTQEPLLASDLVALARQYTKWAHEVRSAAELPLVLQRAFKEAMSPPVGPVFLSIPWEYLIRSIGPSVRAGPVTRVAPRFRADGSEVERAARLLVQAENPIVVAGDGIGAAAAWPMIQELAETIGAPVLTQTFSSFANFPNDDYHWQGELPGSQGAMQQVLRDHDVAFLCGFTNQAQIALFQQSQGPLIPPEVRQVQLSDDSWDLGKNGYAEVAMLGDIRATLPLLNDYLGEGPSAAPERNAKLRLLAEQRRARWEEYLAEAEQQSEIWGALIPQALRDEILGRGLQREFVFVHEALSDWTPFQYLLPLGREAAPESYYAVGGGALGWSMPAALGAAVSRANGAAIKPALVIAATGDGASLFYPQSWWTAGKESLPILSIITNNSEYHTLKMGLDLLVQSFGPAPGYGWRPQSMDPDYLRLGRPKIDFVALAKAIGGVEGETVIRPADVRSAIARGVTHIIEKGQPYLLDIRTLPLTQPPPAPQGTHPPGLDLVHAVDGRTPLIF